MSTSPIDNPFISKLNTVGYTSADDSTCTVVTTPSIIDFSAAGTDATCSAAENVTTPNSVKPIPLVKPKAPNEDAKGLTVETTSKPTLDKQTMKWFGLSQAQWDALSDEEKQTKTETALKGIVDAYNKNQEKLGSNKRLTYAKQVELYRDRTAAGDYGQVKRLTSSVKGLHGKDQEDAIKVAYQFDDNGNRNVAEKTIADDYVDYDKENVLVAAKETKNFSVNNQVSAADNAWLADNSLHKDLVHEYMSRDNKSVQTALAKNVGNFGKDDDDNLAGDGKQIQYDCYKEIISSKYDSVVTTVADNIWTMDKSNQVPAVNDIYATDNTEAKNAIASQYNNYDDDTRQDVGSIISGSDCDSAKSIMEDEVNGNDSYKSEEPEEYTNIEPEINDGESNLSDEINAILDSVTAPSQEQIEKVLNTATETEKSAILKDNPHDVTVIKALLASNPSKGLMDEIIDYLNEGNLNSKEQSELLAMVSGSGAFKGTNSRLGTLNPQLQNTYIQSLPPEELNNINKDDLSILAKDTYDKRLAELKDKDKQSVKKFGILKG